MIYKSSRLMFMMSAALLAYSLLLAVILFIGQQVPPDKQGPVWAILIACVVAVLARKKIRRAFSAFGTAAWATYAELERKGMIGAGTGLFLGRIQRDGAPLTCALKALCNKYLDAKAACGEFLDNFNPRKRKKGRLVRLPQAVHSMVVAPTGVGKGVSCIIPFLLTCEESCVVVDFKGENALITAGQRRLMGHNVVILDPFNSTALSSTPGTS